MKFGVYGARRAFAAVLALWLALVVVCSPAAADPAIWRVEGGPKPVWLFGTFHLLPKDTEWQTPAVKAAFEEAGVLVLEVHLDDAAVAETQKVIKEKAFMKPGQRLRDYLSPEDQAVYETVANELGLPTVVLDRYRPWYASILISVTLYVKEGFKPDAGADTVLQKQAEAAGKAIHSLETATEQLNFLADMPEDMQVAMLKETLHEATELPEQLDALQRAWESGDTKALDALLNDSMRAFPALYDRLLIQRNKNWLPHIEKMIADNQSYFIAVGSAHLVGKNSVIDLLRAKGYKVKGP